jgi:N-acetyl sugar amidotransferase
MTNQQICTRCIMDASVPGIKFDSDGVCSHCRFQEMLENEYPLNEEGAKNLEQLVAKIKKAGQGRKYDCVAGISGGRDSTYTIHQLVTRFGLRPLAVHFNDGFGNPTAGQNMKKACDKLGVELRTITSDWRESKDIRISFLKASTPDLPEGTDVGIGAALYGVAAKEGIKYVTIGQSFRTEGVCPLEWNYLDGKYLKAVHRQFGTYPLRKGTLEDPGFNLDLWRMFQYVVLKGIKVVPILYYVDYVRADVDKLISEELDWVNTGAHYYDDLYQCLMTNLLRVKFGIDRRIFNYSALVRSGQMTREEALERTSGVYEIEDPDVIRLCIKRLGLSQKQFDEFVHMPPKTFKDYPSNYNLIRLFKLPIWLLATLKVIPKTAYSKYFWFN